MFHLTVKSTNIWNAMFHLWLYDSKINICNTMFHLTVKSTNTCNAMFHLWQWKQQTFIKQCCTWQWNQQTLAPPVTVKSTFVMQCSTCDSEMNKHLKCNVQPVTVKSTFVIIQCSTWQWNQQTFKMQYSTYDSKINIWIIQIFHLWQWNQQTLVMQCSTCDSEINNIYKAMLHLTVKWTNIWNAMLHLWQWNQHL